MEPSTATDGVDTTSSNTLGASLPGGLPGILAVAAMACGPAMVGMMLTIVLPILPEIAKDVVGGRNVIIAMPTMGIVVGGIIAGFLLGRMSARTLMLWMIAAFGIVGLAGMVLQDVPLLISRFLMGVVSTCISASSTTLVGELVYPEKRSRVLGLQMAGSSLAGIVAMNVSGFLNDSLGWRFSFALFPLIAIIAFAVGYLLIPPSREPTILAQAVGRQSKPAWRLVLDMWPLYLFLLAMHATAYTPNSQASFVLDADGVTRGAARAQILTVNHTMIVIAAICYPMTRRLLGSRWIPAFFLTLMASGLILLGLSRDIVTAGVALALLGFGNGTLFPHQSNLVLARAASEIRGRAVGLMVSVQFLADSINPFFFPPLIAAVGLHNAIVTIGLIAGAGVVAALIYGSRTANVALPVGFKSAGH